jgi:hypothetical protein
VAIAAGLLLLGALAEAPAAGASAAWKVPLEYLPKRSFKWRGYVANGYSYVDKAPQKGYLTFLVKAPS